MLYGGGSSVNWAASRMTFDPLGPLVDAWSAGAAAGPGWDDPAPDGVDEVEDIFGSGTLDAIDEDEDWDLSVEDE